MKTFKDKVLYPVLTALVTAIFLWFSSSMVEYSRLLSETSDRSFRNETSIKEILVEIKILRTENNELLKFLIANKLVKTN